MNSPTMFSIVLPTFNRPELLKKAIASVRAQEYSNWELVIIDDGTKMANRITLEERSDPRIKYHFQSNQGKGVARNKGLELSTGEYICFLDDDDTYQADHLSSFQEAISKGTNSQIFKTGLLGFENEQLVYQSKFMAAAHKENKIAFVIKNFWLQDLCIKRSLAMSNKFKDYRLWQDKFYLIPLVQENDVYQIPKRTVRLNEHKDRSVNQGYKNHSIVREQVQAVKDAFDDFKLKGTISKTNTINHLLGTHFFHAYKYDGFGAAWKHGFQYLKLNPSLNLFFTLIKYQLSIWFKGLS